MIFSLSVFTDEGICHAFNAKHPKVTFKPSEYMKSFEDVFGGGRDDYVPFNISGVHFCCKLVTFFSFCNPKFLGVGTKNGMTIYLDANSLTGNKS